MVWCKYRLVKGTAPDYIVDGGYFPDDEGNLIGQAEKPPAGSIITDAELRAHVCSLVLDAPPVRAERMNDSQKDAAADDWMARRRTQ